MTSLRDEAKAYVPQQTKNIADLEIISLDVPIAERIGKDKDGKDFKYKVAIVLGEEYRVPNSVFNDIKEIMAMKPAVKSIKVVKKGTGMNTSYTVVQME